MKIRFFERWICFAICALLCSCAHQQALEVQKVQATRKIRSLESDLRKQQVAINNLKEQNWILKQKYLAENRSPAQKIPVPFQPSAAQVPPEDTAHLPSVGATSAGPVATNVVAANAVATNVVATNAAQAGLASTGNSQVTVPAPQAKPEEAIATDSRESAEHNLYAKVIANYRQKRPSELKRVTEILLKTYPQSVFADRAIFLNARLNFENANDPAALAECEKIIRSYPNANKLVATYFLKAQILKKQGHLLEAKSVLSDVQNYFPGSPEAYRVPLELKLLSLQAKAAK